VPFYKTDKFKKNFNIEGGYLCFPFFITQWTKYNFLYFWENIPNTQALKKKLSNKNSGIWALKICTLDNNFIRLIITLLSVLTLPPLLTLAIMGSRLSKIHNAFRKF